MNAIAFGILLTFLFITGYCDDLEDEMQRARDLMSKIDKREQARRNRMSIAEWAYTTNINDETLDNKLREQAIVAKEEKEDWHEIMKLKSWKNFTDEDLKRQISAMILLGTSALPEDKFKRNSELISEMVSKMASAKVCPYGSNEKDVCNLSLEPDLVSIMTTSRHEPNLRHAWLAWRDAVGPHVKQPFIEYVQLQNEAAHLNNFTDNAAYWLHGYEAADIRDQIFQLWEQLKPLYLQLHAYVRSQLRRQYGADIVSKDGPIPAHLLGNMWAQNWGNIADFTLPFVKRKATDVTAKLVEQDYTVKKIFKTSEDFFLSLGFDPMSQEFWNNSILEKIEDGRNMVCHASAWDFYNGSDFRIRQCTRISARHFYTAHHEMGHVVYYMQYKHQPVIYRRGANPGFHEAVGDLIAISVRTPKHLKKIGLMDDTADDEELDINNLYSIGLDKIGFLPYALLIDLWRWEVFEGKTTPENYNCRYWQLRHEYQGVEPPVDRSEDDFDPASKFHIVADVPYLRYFISYVIQFQFHRSLCEKAGQYIPGDAEKPLHKCDIYQSQEAGKALRDMLKMGASRPWMDAMEAISGQRKMDGSGLMEYFQPLQKWLEKENERNGETIGWKATQRSCLLSKKVNKV